MKTRSQLQLLLVTGLLSICVAVPALRAEKKSATEEAVLACLAEIQKAAEDRNVDELFSFVMKNDKGALIQNGVLFRTREEALENTRNGFEGIKSVSYQTGQAHVSELSPDMALVVSEGVTRFTLNDGRSLSVPFAQSVLLKHQANGWRVFHAHRSFPPRP